MIRVKEESEKAGLKLNIQKTKIMASTLWLIDGKKMETVTDFIFSGSKITVDGVILEPKKIKSVTVSTFSSSICIEVTGPDAMVLGL